MSNLNETRRPKQKKVGAVYWLYMGLTFCFFSLIYLFFAKDAKDVVGNVGVFIWGLSMIGSYFLTRTWSPVLRRGMIIAGLLILWVIFSSFVLRFGPRLEMQASQVRISKQRGNVTAQTGFIIRILDVSVESKLFARDYVANYRFTLEADGRRYEDQSDFWLARRDHVLNQSCFEKTTMIDPNMSITCQVAFEVPINVRNGKLVLDGIEYKARADVAF